jgi:hypothetical protein
MLLPGSECRHKVGDVVDAWKLIDQIGLIDAAYLHRGDGMRLSDFAGTCLILLRVSMGM